MIYGDRPPEREVINSPFLGIPSPAYGILAYAKNTGKWLLIQRKYSPDFLMLIRGMYLKVMLKRILTNLSFRERELLAKILENRSALDNFFVGSKENKEYTWKRLNSHKNYIFQILASMSKLWTETEWLWPKGKTEEKSEKKMDCARREFEEESGLSLEGARYTGIGPLIDQHQGSDKKFYETRTWVYIFPEERKLRKPTCNEIARRAWFSHDEALKVLRPSKARILEKAMKGISGLT